MWREKILREKSARENFVCEKILCAGKLDTQNLRKENDQSRRFRFVLPAGGGGSFSTGEVCYNNWRKGGFYGVFIGISAHAGAPVCT